MRKLLFALIFAIPVLWAGAAEKPNIIFILADDLGYRELGCYGQEKIKTPRIDQLAGEGMRFTRAYSGSPVCAPSRCVLMTGMHPGKARVRNNRGGFKPEGQFPLESSDVTIAELLQAEGYTCGSFGKWGLGNIWSEGNPMDQGFDRFFGFNCQSHAHSYYPDFIWSDETKFPLANDPPVPGHSGLAEGADPLDPKSYDPFKGQDYAADHINEQALNFIKANKEKPFFLYYPSLIPHVALHVPDENLKPYLDEKWTDPPFTREKAGYTPHFTPRAAYAAMITQLDTYVGRVLDLVDELGLAENTIVVFTSDNGTTHLGEEVDYEFFNSVGELRGLKGELYEGGIRVPQIVKWPGKVKPGSVTDFVTGFEDWMPTMLDLIGDSGKTPDTIDGISIAKMLLGEDGGERDFLYREFHGYGGQQSVWLGNRWKGIRTGLIPTKRYKKATDPLEVELYDLLKDPSESENVAADHPDIVKKIEGLMASERIVSEDFPVKLLDDLAVRE
ncbi:arylsulfatase [Verrucomicrobiales bacterium BCK34]|nr:arylsulfatase [Verrucomicrobiales bacterium BCK34]